MVLSQAENTGFILLTTPYGRGRANSGMMCLSLTTRSFILMNSAARLTASNSVWEALWAASNSALLQRARLRLDHLLAFCESSPVVNCSMNTPGSGVPMVVVNICMSDQNFW